MISRYIAIDWGSTNLRAWLYQDGECLDSRQSASGITRLNGQTPQAVLNTVTDGWRDANTPVLMAGMVGSNAGWINAPYLPCPTAFSAIGEQLTAVIPDVWIIPGLSVDRDDNHNVIRGEETQLIGAAALAPASLYIMPGTHCKWVQADAERIHDFRTVMTGELHHLLLTHSLVGVGIGEQETCDAAFDAGMEQGINDDAIITRLFEVRASHALGALPRSHVSEYLSGLLIGNEVAMQMRRYQHAASAAITVVANQKLCARYQRVLARLGFSATPLEGDTAFQAGIRSIAHAMAN